MQQQSTKDWYMSVFETGHPRASLGAAGVLACALASASVMAQTRPATSRGVQPAAQSQPAHAAAASQSAPEIANVDPTWLEKLKDEDRTAINELRGYEIPGFTGDLTWIGTQPLNWNDLRGKVVVLQSFTTANIAGRKWPERAAGSLKGLPPAVSKDVRIIALHTPENAEKAADFLAKQPPPEGVSVAIDPKGAYCDALGIYKTPVNIVVDRHGAVRYVGLNERGLSKAVAQLAEEKFDANKRVPRHDAPAAAPLGAKGQFPAAVGRVAYADDLRGKAAPDFAADEWMTAQPDMRNKVVVIDFWATWCKPCVEAIPHMTALADKFGDQIVFIGLSDEKQTKFEEGLRKINRKVESFHYNLALDPAASMQKGFGIKGIPHCVVISSDWIVRWQGSPGGLTDQVLEQIIKADASANGSDAGKPGSSSGQRSTHRWMEK
jgi:thiol-disulfide isomerase/thioredoxin